MVGAASPISTTEQAPLTALSAANQWIQPHMPKANL